MVHGGYRRSAGDNRHGIHPKLYHLRALGGNLIDYCRRRRRRRGNSARYCCHHTYYHHTRYYHDYSSYDYYHTSYDYHPASDYHHSASHDYNPASHDHNPAGDYSRDAGVVVPYGIHRKLDYHYFSNHYHTESHYHHADSYYHDSRDYHKRDCHFCFHHPENYEYRGYADDSSCRNRKQRGDVANLRPKNPCD